MKSTAIATQEQGKCNGRSRSYVPSPIKRKPRRTKADMAVICDALEEILIEEHPSTIRHVFYVGSSRGLYPKTEAAYKQIVCRKLADMRRSGRIPYSWLSDGTRWQIKPRSYGCLGDALEHTADYYRRDLWASQNDYVEVWAEKDAICGILRDVTARWDVPLMIARGYSSLTFLYNSAMALREQERPCYIYQFGDHDPSGVNAWEVIERTLRQFAPDTEIHFERIAVTPVQIEEWDLPTRPTKTDDTRSKNFFGESVEVDAIAPHKLRELCNDCIEQHIDQERLRNLKRVEDAERDTLQGIIDRFNAGEDN